jgi:F0F1-type ATP synthase assembly protein I
MTNVTITVKPETLRRARAKALEQGTSVNAVLGELLDGYAGSSPAGQAVAEFLDIAARLDARRAPGETWTREELHDRAGLR